MASVYPVKLLLWFVRAIRYIGMGEKKKKKIHRNAPFHWLSSCQLGTVHLGYDTFKWAPWQLQGTDWVKVLTKTELKLLTKYSKLKWLWNCTIGEWRAAAIFVLGGWRKKLRELDRVIHNEKNILLVSQLVAATTVSFFFKNTSKALLQWYIPKHNQTLEHLRLATLYVSSTLSVQCDGAFKGSR